MRHLCQPPTAASSSTLIEPPTQGSPLCRRPSQATPTVLNGWQPDQHHGRTRCRSADGGHGWLRCRPEACSRGDAGTACRVVQRPTRQAELKAVEETGWGLLLILALHGVTGVQSGALADILWSDKPPAKPSDSLRKPRWRLRKELESDPLPTDPDGDAVVEDRLRRSDRAEGIAQLQSSARLRVASYNW